MAETAPAEIAHSPEYQVFVTTPVRQVLPPRLSPFKQKFLCGHWHLGIDTWSHVEARRQRAEGSRFSWVKSGSLTNELGVAQERLALLSCEACTSLSSVINFSSGDTGMSEAAEPQELCLQESVVMGPVLAPNSIMTELLKIPASWKRA